MMPAVNIKGVFNTSNETSYEKEPPTGMKYISIQHHGLLNFYSLMQTTSFPLYMYYNFSLFVLLFPGIAIDFNFYQTFWSLQV